MGSEQFLLLSVIIVFSLMITIQIAKFYIEFFRMIKYYKTEIRRAKSRNESKYWRRKLKYHKSKFLFGIPLMRLTHIKKHKHKHKHKHK